MALKLIAIRPLMNYNAKFLKNLKKAEVYKFYNDCKFTFAEDNPAKEILSMEIVNDKVPKNFYDVAYSTNFLDNLEKHNISISISAIVGKNGSGKSSLADLFLVSLFFISYKLKFVESADFIEDDDEIEYARYKKDIKNMEDNLEVEIYYQLDADLFKLKITKGSIYLDRSIPGETVYHFQQKYISIEKKGDLPPFFYSMIVNYSIYGFNTNHMGIWLKGVFHKNDGYQMPIVINPYKNIGNININTETYLTRGRVLSNLVTIKDYRKTINSKSEVDKIEIYFDRNKNYTDKYSPEELAEFRDKLIVPLFEKMFIGEYFYPYEDTPIVNHAEYYLMQKIKLIPSKYKIFEAFKEPLDDSLVSKFIDALYKNRTHITLKIFQTLNFIQDHSYYEIPSGDFRTNLDFDTVTRAIEEKIDKQWFTQPVEYLPPPFLVTKIVFKDGSTFDDLSSGEMQKIFSLNSIIYHISNLDSVKKHHVLESAEPPIIYEHVNLILDEIELYYHPEYQRTFVNDLLNFIKNAEFKSIKNFNILFLTHSPFILSDIPNSNILFLEISEQNVLIEGITKTLKLSIPQEINEQTFAANVHEIFRSSFFMKSTKGQFAENKITEVIRFCKKVEYCDDYDELKLLQNYYFDKKREFEMLIELIGEEYIQLVLKNSLVRIDQKLVPEKENLEKRAAALEEELLKIKARLNDKS